MESVIFSVTTRYQNLDLRDWNADKEHHEASFKASLVSRITGLREDDIVDISAVDKSTRRLTTIDDAIEVPSQYSPIHDQRMLIIKRLELAVTFSIRTQYFNHTNEVSSADIFNAVTSRIDSTSSDILSDLQSDSTYFANAIVLSTTSSSYSLMQSRSAYPSSSPTSQPSCGLGSSQVGSGCGPCLEGYYSDSLNAFECTACPLDTYNTMIGSVQCTPCGAFAANIHEASTSCPHFALHASSFTYVSLGSFVTILFLSALLFAGENAYIMFILGLFPFLDILSDMVYILSIKFWSFELFICAIVFFVVPSFMFVFKLSRMKAYPRLIKFAGLTITDGVYLWLSVSPDGSPLVNGERLTLSYLEHDGIEKLVWYWVFWILLLTAQVVFVALSIVWQFVSIVLAIAWLFTGLFLYQTKMLAIGKVWNTWFYTWTQCSDFDKEIGLDASVLNESLFYEFMLETVPQIAIQSVNNSLIYTGNLPAISLFSLAISIFIAINGIYRYGYYLLWKGIKFDEIPLPLAVRMQKINKSLLPRRSMLTKKLVSLVNSLKVGDPSTFTAKVTRSNVRHMSQIMLSNEATPTAVVASANIYLSLCVLKLKSINKTDSSIEFATCVNEFKEVVGALTAVIQDTQTALLATAHTDYEGNVDRDNGVVIDISSILRRGSKVAPIISNESINNTAGKEVVVSSDESNTVLPKSVLRHPSRVSPDVNIAPVVPKSKGESSTTEQYHDLNMNRSNDTVDMVRTSNTDDITAYSGALRTASRNEAVISVTEAQVKVISERNHMVAPSSPNVKKNSSINKNVSVSSEEVRAASAVDKVMKSVAVPSKTKISVDIFELSDSDLSDNDSGFDLSDSDD